LNVLESRFTTTLRGFQLLKFDPSDTVIASMEGISPRYILSISKTKGKIRATNLLTGKRYELIDEYECG